MTKTLSWLKTKVTEKDNNASLRRQSRQRAITHITVFQTVYLTIKHFLANRLLSYAGACSFSFLFSFIPVFMLIAMVLLRILHASTDTITQAFNALPELQEYINAETAIKIARHSGTSASFQIVLSFFIFWMARRFFATVFDSVQCIFHTREQRKAVIKQVLTLAVEVAVVIIAAAVIFVYVSLRTMVILPFFGTISAKFPQLTGAISRQYIVQLPNLLLLFLTTIIYRVSSGTKPSLKLCLLAAALCTGSFWAFRYVLHLFLNTANYNLIYGVLGRLIVTLLDIFFFFVIFLFCAELIFTMQFFDILLLGELYLLPELQHKGMFCSIRRSLFIHPDFLLAKDSRAIRLKSGEAVYRAGDTDSDAYYI
ncbi:MAG: YihY/virulence factor BrkB family protein, partial [Treponema sp.]|nr:YihY/virulence factor BrkB family protein [Treponema sp.]